MDTVKTKKDEEALKSIAKDRQRTNILREPEQKLIAFLVQRMPSWVTSNMLTGFGLFGNAFIGASFIIAFFFGRIFLLLGLLGLIFNWFGDSLDGRLAYYRNKSRKWYGFALDIVIDWIGIILIGFGVIVYIDGPWDILGYLFVVLYGWEMILALLRYKITGNYSIDSGIFSPTEVRIVIGLILILEVIFVGSIFYAAGLVCIVLVILNYIDSKKILKLADLRDKEK